MREQLKQLDEPTRQYPLVPLLEWLLSGELAQGESRELTLSMGNRTERDGGPWVRLQWTSSDGTARRVFGWDLDNLLERAGNEERRARLAVAHGAIPQQSQGETQVPVQHESARKPKAVLKTGV